LFNFEHLNVQNIDTMTLKQLSLSLFLCSLCISGLAQEKNLQIQLLQKGSKKPVQYANVCWQNLKNPKQKGNAVADFQGKLNVSNTDGGKLILSVSCVGYKSVHDTLQLTKSQIIYIEKDVFNLDQVIVTGESKPVLSDNSIYRVKLIGNDKIRQSGASNLSELIMTQANINISSDLILGSQIEMMGMAGSNVKVMIDGVPVVGRLSGNVDLSQVNLANIDHVEIIEGPMSVVYGNNALAGTINLITKNNKYHDTQIQLNTNVESVGKYGGDLLLSKKLGSQTFTFNGGYEYFDGVDFESSTRSMEWKPKTQYRGNLSYQWKKNNWNFNARFRAYYDELLNKSDVIDTYMAEDTYYYTTRYDASAGIVGTWAKKNHLNVLLAYSYYDRSSRIHNIDLRTLESSWDDKESSQDLYQLMLRAIYDRTMVPKRLSLQSGIDLSLEDMAGPRMDEDTESLGNYAVFANLKYKLFSNFEIQPGLRYAYNTGFDAPLVYSLNFKWNINTSLIWRASAAKGFRAPALKELYYIFVDSNHEIYGNASLEAEYSYNYNTSLNFKTTFGKHQLQASVSAYYNNLFNMISLLQEQNSTSYKYINIDKYKTRGGDIELNYNYKSILSVRGGYGITARYNEYNETVKSNQFNLTHDYFAGATITEPKTGIRLSIDYKYSGKESYFYTNTKDEIVGGFQASYQIMNASVGYDLWKRKLKLTLGAKNILDVKSVKQNGASSGHSSGTDSTPVSYGRSYFLKLIYNIK